MSKKDNTSRKRRQPDWGHMALATTTSALFGLVIGISVPSAQAEASPQPIIQIEPALPAAPVIEITNDIPAVTFNTDEARNVDGRELSTVTVSIDGDISERTLVEGPGALGGFDR